MPHVVETQQWGDNLLFWVGDKAIGGKMCVILNLDSIGVAFPVSPERFAELVEIEGIIPAKYLARLSWVSTGRWNVLRTAEWHQAFRDAHAITYAKLPPRTKAILAQPKTEQRRILAERKKLLAERAARKG